MGTLKFYIHVLIQMVVTFFAMVATKLYVAFVGSGRIEPLWIGVTTLVLLIIWGGVVTYMIFMAKTHFKDDRDDK